MKRVIFYATWLTSSLVYGQNPETVYPITQERKENDWYATQQKVWKEKVESNATDGVAWTNYYTATRCLRFLARENNSPSKEALNEECGAIVTKLKLKKPGSFEAYYLDYWNNGSFFNASSLQSAYNANPKDTRTYQDLMVHYYLLGNKEAYKEFALRIYDCNVMSPIMLNWAYNVSVEIEKNGIVLTQGDNDTYALLTILAVRDRLDVSVVNTTMYLSDAYQDAILKQIGYKKVAFTKDKSSFTSDAYAEFCLKHLLEGKRHVYLDCNSDQANLWDNANPLASFASKFYLYGLTYKYSEVAFDNIGVIRKNYENYYLLDNITYSWSHHYTDAVAKNQFYAYAPSMLKLYLHYQQCEEFEKADKLKKLIAIVDFNKVIEPLQIKAGQNIPKK
jgi:hypothetical protein